MRRAWLPAVLAVMLLAAEASPANAHSAFLGSTPAPGTRLSVSPREVSLTFTEKLNDRLSRASVARVDGAEPTGVSSSADGAGVVLHIATPLATGAYRVRWHTVSASDGHALEGSFSFGVRAAAAGGGHDVQASPFARDGWLRVLARGLLYSSLLLFTGAVMLDALLGRPGRDWLVPASLARLTPALDTVAVASRRRRILIDSGLLAAGAAALSAVADAVDAAGGFSVRGLDDFLLAGTAGFTRLGVVALLLVTLGGVVLRRRSAAVPAAAALGCIALSGHANASSPRGLAVANDWLHLGSSALWMGGVAYLVLTWGPTTRRVSAPERLVLAREVLPRFGRVALPAFALVLLTGLISAVIELGRVSELWQSDYGRVLILKAGLVCLVVSVSYTHAMRIRPRLLAGRTARPPALERRHWRLLRSEPLLAVGIVCAVAVLVAFPLPPRQLGEAEEAEAASLPACVECPLPRPAGNELAVADDAGSDVVAAWVRRDPTGLSGTVRLYGLRHAPADDEMTIIGATQTSCGVGCQRFHLPDASPVLRVAVFQGERTYHARLPTTWQPDREGEARGLLETAQRTMRRLHSVQEFERTNSVPGLYAETTYRLQAPDRMALRTDRGVQSVIIGARQWMRVRGSRWSVRAFGGGLPFRTRSWFTWTSYARRVYLLGRQREGGHDVAVVALMDQGTPAWWRVYIDVRTHRVLHDRLITYGHFSTERFSAVDRPGGVTAPKDLTP